MRALPEMTKLGCWHPIHASIDQYATQQHTQEERFLAFNGFHAMVP